jgi:hypothetical protein
MFIKSKIFIFSLYEFTNENEAIALSEDGEVLIHSRYIGESDIPYDFGIKGTNNKNYHERYNSAFPKGWEAVFVPKKEIPKNKELQKALKKFVENGTLDDEEKII